MAEGQRIVFMGSPRFAEITLRNLLSAGLEIAGVYTQPERAAGRGMAGRETAVWELAHKNGLPIFQPENFRAPAEIERLAALEPDYLIVAAYGLLLPQKVLEIPKIAPLNIHASLLPLYRGAAPIQRAIQENWQADAKTGVSIMRIVRELDAGPVYAQTELPIAGRTTEELSDALAEAGSRLLLDILPDIPKLVPEPQNEAKATYAHKLQKADGRIDWQMSAPEIDALVRAMNPWPGAAAVFSLNGKPVHALIRAGKPVSRDLPDARHKLIYSDKKLYAGCRDGLYEITRIQLPGKRELAAAEFANGRRLAEGVAGELL